MSMSNSKVAQRFADGKIKGKGRNMFVREDIVYSYGTHYPICRRYFKDGVDYLFNMPYGSSSTASHCSHVRSAISGSSVLVVENCDIDNAGCQIRTNEREIAGAEIKKEKARKESMIEYWQDRIAELEAQNEILSFIAAKRRLLEAAENEKRQGQR